VLDDVSFRVAPGEAVGIVGESGCGKTTVAMAIIGLLSGGATVDEQGGVLFEGRDLTRLTERELERVRGREIALISQEPVGSLTPTLRVGSLVAEAVREHHGGSRREANGRALELLRMVRLPEPALVARRYAHELSGGMAQRVAIARALAGDPKLLIADEPTTALDVTVQADILELLRQLQKERHMAILVISHDLGLIADICDRVVVMYAGEVIEQATASEIFRQPLHPYTEALLNSNPTRASPDRRLPAIAGTVPNPGAWPQGCHFHPRCPSARSECREALIEIESPTPGRETRCVRFSELFGHASSHEHRHAREAERR
jgi:peptide/nickel transport system permease protein